METRSATWGRVFLDDQTGRPEFVTVQTGFLGANETLMPVAQATVSGDGLTFPFRGGKVKDAPNVDVDGGHLDQEQRLYEYYGMGYTEPRHDNGPDAGDELDAVGHDASGPTTDEAMTRSGSGSRLVRPLRRPAGCGCASS